MPTSPGPTSTPSTTERGGAQGRQRGARAALPHPEAARAAAVSSSCRARRRGRRRPGRRGAAPVAHVRAVHALLARPGWHLARREAHALPPAAGRHRARRRGACSATCPERFVAVKFYSTPLFPLDDERRAFVRTVMDRLTAQTDVVVLAAPVDLDDHEDFAPSRRGRSRAPPTGRDDGPRQPRRTDRRPSPRLGVRRDLRRLRAPRSVPRHPHARLHGRAALPAARRRHVARHPRVAAGKASTPASRCSPPTTSGCSA